MVNVPAPVADPIAGISVLSTGTVAIRPEHVEATGKPMYWWLLTSRRWTSPRPVNVYVIEHRDGLVLFDSGQDRASVTDPDYFPGGVTGVMYDRLAASGSTPLTPSPPDSRRSATTSPTSTPR
jgi:N-acyl homoserine lactone hydrolase